MAGRLEGKVALITGGGSGIGRACALLFAREGAAICAADMNLEGAATTVQAVEQAGGKALAVQVDTTDEGDCTAMVERCVEAFDGVDVLIAAAGISSARPPAAPAAEPWGVLNTPAEAFKRVVDVNFYGVLFSDRAVARWLVAHRRPGSIINLGSVASRVPLPGGAYSVSKAGVWMLTKVMGAELAKTGVRVNAIGPGFIETPMTALLREDEARSQWALGMTPMGRYGKPEEIANTALFLASDDSSYFTGEILHPAGGMFTG
ncbi:MAG: SDR family NAD(P)-dependent oxidoreductase [Dehalococcoidia bacterium]